VDLRHLRIYDEIDIALDPFPWNGHTTACEALWMGVPVIALRGQRHSSRMVASLLTCIGLTEFLAETCRDYCQIAADWASHLPELAQWRLSLRPKIIESPLCNGPTFLRNLEQAYCQMWQIRSSRRKTS
jgi:predicted O-linked N-acetylglucosamine transferase (SPINDLY family)